MDTKSDAILALEEKTLGKVGFNFINKVIKLNENMRLTAQGGILFILLFKAPF
ncbi:hypothetical protein PTE_00056 [Photorhabdus khanii NC19]|uniref:Uncharacterized protein n=1 Tax=Photorhabdus khanii NC19 TaxID=1004151 RepID=W3VAE5_9GAMM|nr:hypothetical protein PTE_00056 [Photorhabdus khanii NC19]